MRDRKGSVPVVHRGHLEAPRAAGEKQDESVKGASAPARPLTLDQVHDDGLSNDVPTMEIGGESPRSSPRDGINVS
jgi:hypothetical protein